MNWRIRAVPLTKNLFFLGSRSMAPCYSVTVRVRASMLALIDDVNTCHWLPRDEAPIITSEKHHCRQHYACSQTPQRHLARKALLCPDESVHMEDHGEVKRFTVRCWMRMMSVTYPVNTCLYRIKKVKSPSCTFCERVDIETPSHFVKVCPKFHHARITAPNRVRQALFKLLNYLQR